MSVATARAEVVIGAARREDGEREVDVQVLTLAAGQGPRVELEATGDDAEDAVAALRALLEGAEGA